jgi:hypothetical protein
MPSRPSLPSSGHEIPREVRLLEPVADVRADAVVEELPDGRLDVAFLLGQQ